MNKSEIIEQVIEKLEDNGWDIKHDYYEPLIIDIIDILEESKNIDNSEDRSYKGVF